MTLENQVSTRFNIKMTTDRAIIAQNICIHNASNEWVQIIQEAVIPKVSSLITETKDDITYAQVEHWVLKQRLTESKQSFATDTMVDELVNMAQSDDMPF